MRTLYSFIFLLSLFAAKAQKSQWIVFDSSTSSIPTNTIYQIAIDDSNNVYCGSDLGILKFDGTNWTVIDTEYVTQGGYVSISTYGNKVYYSKNNNLRIYDGNNFQSFTYTYGISPPGMGCLTFNRAIAINDSGTAGIASWVRGFGTFDGTNWTMIDSTYNPFCLATKYNNFWMGTRNSGLIKYNGTNCTVWDTANSLIPTHFINSITIDKWGNIWMANAPNIIYPGSYYDTEGYYEIYKGLIKYDHVGFTSYTQSNSGLPDSLIISLSSDTLGNIWMGTCNKGLVNFDGINWSFFDTTNSPIPKSYVSWIAIDKNNNKWISFATEMEDDIFPHLMNGSGVAVYNENGVMGVTGINDFISSKVTTEINTYPNPSNEEIHFSLNSDELQYCNLSIFDIQGKEIIKLFENKRISGNEDITCNASSLKSGMYFYKLFSDKTVCSGKILIQK